MQSIFHYSISFLVKPRGVAILIALIYLFGLAIQLPVSAQTTNLIIRTKGPGKPISADLMGVFFEDLNYAADGGIYAELIQNRSFEYSPTHQRGWHPLKFWDLEKRGEGDGFVDVADMRPINQNNPTYILLTVQVPGEGFGISNGGFDCIPVKAGERYMASFWAYQAFMGQMWGRGGDNSKPMPVSLRLETRDGEVLADTSIKITGRAWTKFSATFVSPRTVTNARLVLLAHERGGICLDMISLFPEKTFGNRSNGLRADLAQAIADINPKFIRFPGGCLVHGQGIHQYYDWKHSVGPVEQRKSGRNLWGYDQTLGLGYYEFFQYCEDIGAKPLPVVSAGVCCQHAGSSPGRGQEGLPLEEMPTYVQDVLDLIEWANGPATSKWGAVRAAAGHPEPFNLKYLGVGNEDAITAIFKERFKMLYDTLKIRHPEIVVVGTVGPFHSGRDYDDGWEFARELKLDMVDEHYYVPPQWFWDNQKRYDIYPRATTKVYVGEYAAHDYAQKKNNTLRSALAEAAGLTSFERNGDIIQFTSYAPLLSRRGHTQWIPDMIYFDSTSVYKSANYYVQMLFGQNSGDHYLDTQLDTTAAIKLAVSTVLDSKSGDVIIKIVNGENSPKELNIHLTGLPSGLNMSATRTVLTGPNANAENEDGKAPVVSPQVSAESVMPVFTYRAPANSLTIYRINR